MNELGVMDFREKLNELLLKDPGKENTRHLAALSARSGEIPSLLFDIAIRSNYPQNWRAAWTLKGIWEISPAYVEPFIGEMIKVLPTVPNNGVRREFLRILSDYPPPDNEDNLSILLNHCFDCLTNLQNPIAVKIHSISILLKIVDIIPEIKGELATAISLAMYEGSPGMLNRGSKALRALQKM
jgi:hypothetical protein